MWILNPKLTPFFLFFLRVCETVNGPQAKVPLGFFLKKKIPLLCVVVVRAPVGRSPAKALPLLIYCFNQRPHHSTKKLSPMYLSVFALGNMTRASGRGFGPGKKR